MPIEKRWVVKPQGDPATAAMLAAALRISPVLANLLVQRGIDTVEKADKFFKPSLADLHDPFLMKDMDKAVERVEQAVRNNEKIMVYGDYDVDGCTAVALVYKFLRQIGHKNLMFYIPDRYTEGYGISVKGIDLAARKGVGLIIALDCGIKATEKVVYAKTKGVDFIICDHHLPAEEIPRAVAVLDPKRVDCSYPFDELSGCGVGFKLVQAYAQKNRIPFEQISPLLDLLVVSIASDIVPLVGENRILAHFGLKDLNREPSKGLLSIIKICGLDKHNITIDDIVFKIGPRINAAGRLGSPTLAHDMLLTPSHDEAAKLAQTLTSLNDERRSEEDRIYKEALEQAEANPKRLGFVLYGKDWHQGVIGIVASRIVEVYYRPVLILCSDGESLKGSGRSVPEFDLHAGLTRCADMLLGFGGHRQAAGLRIAPGRLDELRERFDAVIREELGEAPLTPSLKIDAEMPFSQASDFTVLKGLELLQPFGIGNPEPIFASLPLRVKKRKAFGHSREHISLEVTEEGSGITLQAKAWRQADQIPESIQGQRIRLAYTPGINAYNGIASVELRVRDWEVL